MCQSITPFFRRQQNPTMTMRTTALYRLFLLACILLSSCTLINAQSSEQDDANENEPAESAPPDCQAICDDRLTPLQTSVDQLRDELDFVVKDRNELKNAHESALQQRADLQSQVSQANDKSDGLVLRVQELERDLSSSRSHLEAAKNQLAVVMVELDIERSKVGFFARLQDELKVWCEKVTKFVNKGFKKRKDGEL
ncbi:hypothetical protein MPSEU_000023500 [Mayamaea pseudoterrestris]|nr:hypothetical protein MPSEU_000023500 [Mayamaea pseudoterrestris]